MEKQLEFILPEIDCEVTKKAVEAALEKYRIFLLTLRLDQLPRVTQQYSLVSPSNTNKFHSSTEEMAIRNADYERERSEYAGSDGSELLRLLGTYDSYPMLYDGRRCI
ncbi:ArpU family phage transcriptional regulator [Anoxybacillus caldiproteolyticus]|uniref:ArpU family phage transcriptional regulator n=1 Tax=Thermaerobacillus caldiproteolyticus TaxID=247480 RepID=A0A7V9Z5Y8_9BACL|nr:ArpU family phage packaging/lysis transcriptional regulator [Anoxybacillus caldiproteolyticus]MBA2874677.1 ArpU family phage transcriptional regulator [Anoxybacillus caldiproteolyticus]